MGQDIAIAQQARGDCCGLDGNGHASVHPRVSVTGLQRGRNADVWLSKELQEGVKRNEGQ
ncbi:hypothetical protein X772_35240 [Mesorhizobium sp. LSJC280B00]|nr:hypothetical protein X772_35240 [Mesorhizobium sp. LSJC280B00]